MLPVTSNPICLPKEIFCDILERLSVRELVQCERVCKTWKEFIDTNFNVVSFANKIGNAKPQKTTPRYGYGSFGYFSGQHTAFAALTCLYAKGGVLLAGSAKGTLFLEMNKVDPSNIPNLCCFPAHSTSIQALSMVGDRAVSGAQSIKVWDLSCLPSSLGSRNSTINIATAISAFFWKSALVHTFNKDLDWFGEPVTSLDSRDSLLLSSGKDSLFLWNMDRPDVGGDLYDSTAWFSQFLDSKQFLSIDTERVVKIWNRSEQKPSKALDFLKKEPLKATPKFHFIDPLLLCYTPSWFLQFDLRNEKIIPPYIGDTPTSLSSFKEFICFGDKKEIHFYTFKGEKIHTMTSNINVDLLHVVDDTIFIGQRNPVSSIDVIPLKTSQK